MSEIPDPVEEAVARAICATWDRPGAYGTYLSLAQELIAAHVAALEAAGFAIGPIREWQLIETAPSDGLPVWTWTVHWPKKPPQVGPADGNWWRLARDRGWPKTITHWMPLETPAPPQQEASHD